MLATIAAACGAATVLAVRSVEARDLHWRLVAADQPTWDALGRDRPLRPYRDLEYFRSELARAGIDTGRKDGPTAVAVLRYMLNEVRAVGTETPPTARAALEHARRGGGLTCGPLALLYSHLLVAAGYRARSS